jgi:hypothetical protein
MQRIFYLDPLKKKKKLFFGKINRNNKKIKLYLEESVQPNTEVILNRNLRKGQDLTEPRSSIILYIYRKYYLIK